ncbi:MAG: tetratricopeptide repeat protein [Ktedonobacterales bacterium]
MSGDAQVDFDELWDYVLWNYEQPTVSEARFRAILLTLERENVARDTSSRSYRAEVETQIARAQGLQGAFAAAHATLDHVADVLDEARTRTRIRYLLERGRIWNSAGEPERAYPLFVQAWELARQDDAERFYAIDAAHMLAIVTPGDEQIAWNRRALDLAEQAPDGPARWWAASLYNNLGWTYHGMEAYEEALACFQAALPWWEARGRVCDIWAARWSIGYGLRSLGRYAEAVALQQELLAEQERSGETSDSYVCEEIGECLLALGLAEASRSYFAKSYDIVAADAATGAAEAERLERLRRLSGVTGSAHATGATGE